jgi:hypothetical protein
VDLQTALLDAGAGVFSQRRPVSTVGEHWSGQQTRLPPSGLCATAHRPAARAGDPPSLHRTAHIRRSGLSSR